METQIQFHSSQFYDTESFYDPIWKSIKVSVFEMRLINTPEFQRLREIKQLGFVNLVYGAAEHSRFIHSIGVCHHSKLLVSQVNENFKNSKRYRAWRSSGINDTTIAPDYKAVKITAIEKIIISAAALLHDLPHSPFSHEIESPNSNPLTGIPTHDEFEKNPVLFKYLFDKEHSTIAKIIELYNAQFWELLNQDKLWLDRIKEEYGDDFDSIFPDDGHVPISKSSIVQPAIDNKYERLPILGVMIFELHLFEKPEHWVVYDKDAKALKPAKYREVQTEWDGSENSILKWKPISGWFRPYRKDIVGNTICADLIDYIERDGKQTGIISSIDLKFLDRMTISKAVPERQSPTELKIKWKVIPSYCEHIVFDIYDHKRGFIRESVITEILSCLQARYQLTERVYNHRVVEGARSMLQEISRLLCSIKVLDVKLLHTIDPGEPNCPTGDNTFLSWVMDTNQRIKPHHTDEEKNKILAAAKLAKALKERRIYREAVIIDGIHGYITGSLAGGESNCKSLEHILLADDSDITSKREEVINNISNDLRAAYKKMFNKELDTFEQLATIGARKFGKKYKVPRVLVAKPFSNNRDNINIDIQPLFACEDPPHIKIQLDSMKLAYDSLWRVYLFIHPAFHWDIVSNKEEVYVNLHKEISKRFLSFTNGETPIHWENSIDFKQLLPTAPIDYVEFIENYPKQQSVKETTSKAVEISEILTDDGLQQIIDNLIAEIFAKIPGKDGIRKQLKKERKKVYQLIKNDNEAENFFKNEANLSLLVNKLPDRYFSHDNRTQSGEAKDFYDHIKKIIRDSGSLFNNL